MNEFEMRSRALEWAIHSFAGAVPAPHRVTELAGSYYQFLRNGPANLPAPAPKVPTKKKAASSKKR